MKVHMKCEDIDYPECGQFSSVFPIIKTTDRTEVSCKKCKVILQAMDKVQVNKYLKCPECGASVKEEQGWVKEHMETRTIFSCTDCDWTYN